MFLLLIGVRIMLAAELQAAWLTYKWCCCEALTSNNPWVKSLLYGFWNESLHSCAQLLFVSLRGLNLRSGAVAKTSVYRPKRRIIPPSQYLTLLFQDWMIFLLNKLWVSSLIILVAGTFLITVSEASHLNRNIDSASNGVSIGWLCWTAICAILFMLSRTQYWLSLLTKHAVLETVTLQLWCTFVGRSEPTC